MSRRITNSLRNEPRESNCVLVQTKNWSSRHGLTLLEVLIATTLTLLILLGLTQGFKTISDSVSEGRTRISLSDELRGIVSLLKEDLDLRTSDGDASQNMLSPTGYFKYYDGWLTDWTALVANVPNPTLIQTLPPESKKEAMLNLGSRWGDIDDLLMFTARAKSGEAFRGKIPRALMLIANWNEATKQGLAPPPLVLTDDDWATDLTISSEFAEIAWFPIPVTLLSNGTFSPASIFGGGDESVLNPVDGMPRRIALCRRVLLIRPDLDITPPPNLRSYATTPEDRLFYMQPESPFHVTSSSTQSFELLGAHAYQRCDLSCSTQLVDAPTAVGTYLSYRTNSLSDLQDPQNRYAHGVYPVADNGTVIGSTYPLLMLTAGIPIPNPAAPTPPFKTGHFILSSVNETRIAAGVSSPVATSAPSSGFIPPQFLRTKYRRPNPTNRSTWVVIPTLQEFVAMNVVGFDLKGFDSSAPVLFHPGPDGLWGAGFVDDNNDGTPDNALEAGWVDGDDQTVTPSDPGYWTLIAGGTFEESGRGAYVDLGWGLKGLGLPVMTSLTKPLPVTTATQLVGELSGVTVFPNTATLTASRYLGHSGSICLPPNNVSIGNTTGLFVCQTAYDTFTTLFDSDGETDNRGPHGAGGYFFRFYQPGLRRLGYPLPVGGFPLNLDPVIEDTTAPFPGKLRSIQATIRVQDTGANAIQQLSIIHALSK